MNTIAADNGWRGFNSAGTKVPGGWQYDCDGMPTLMGCGAQITVTRQYVRTGRKSSGWLVTFGLEPDTEDTPIDSPTGWHEDKDVVLTFCPRCADIVEAQDRCRKEGTP